jgi:SAM-dependent methyltransferase
MLKNTRVLPKDVLDVVKRSRPVYSAARALRFAAGERLGARPVSGLSGRVHYNDFMLLSTDPADVDHYVRGANRFIDIIERSCAEAGRDPASLRDVLEVGCGYGRIVRELRKRLPEANIFVSDVIDAAARFTAAEFGAHKMPTLEHAGPEFDGRFDLAAVLKPGGVVVMTVHGQGSADTCERYQQYWLDKARLLEALARDGYYYERYPYYYDDYGLTWFTRPTFEQLVAEATPQLTAVAYHALDLDAHQDVFVYRKDA